ncbi:MAG: spondin domain-containing protein [Planctomycetota bacterium]
MSRCAVVALACVTATGVVSAQQIQVTFDNLLPENGTAFTPVFVGLHDGTFDLFNPGEAVTSGLERVAELGATDELTAEFNGSAGSIDGATTGGGPVLGGQSRSVVLDGGGLGAGGFLTFATMVVPTNDLFIGNPNQTGIRVFDDAGEFVGPFTITIFGSQVWDAGTEVNDLDDGAAFLAGIAGTAGTDQGGTAQLFFNDPSAQSFIDGTIGRQTAPGFVVASSFTELTPIAQIRVVPSPGAAALAATGLLLGVRRRR